MADLSTIKELAEKWLKGTITEAEKRALENWYNQNPEQIMAWRGEESGEELKETMLAAILKGIGEEEKATKILPLRYRKIFRRTAAAAAVLILLAAGYWLANIPASRNIAGNERPVVKDLPPGKDGAVLTLANGTRIALDSAVNGDIARQGNATIQKQNGRLSYALNQEKIDGKEVFNTMTTPKGMKYRLILSDGSGVWLNAASSITYPVAFSGKERRVSISGEAYFEIAHNEKAPFIVTKGNASVQVLGTHFNVNAYDDENTIQVTLLEGSVKVKSETKNQKSEIKINPNEQAVIKRDGELSINKNMDVDDVVAWKNGLFSFQNADIKTVMRQLARWYDIEIVYEGSDYNETFSGKIGRNLSLRELLDGLAQTRVHYKIEGKNKLIVLP